MTTLMECWLCRRLFNSAGQKICPDCIKKLDSLYGSVHEYMRDHKDEDFDMDKLAEDMEINPAYIKALVDLGYIEAVIRTEDGKEQDRKQKLAAAFSQELEKMQKDKITTYGGVIYSRERKK